MAKTVCPNCGGPIDINDIFCAFCGNQLKTDIISKNVKNENINFENDYMNIFFTDDWQNNYRNIEDPSIILTNTHKLKNKDSFLDSVSKFINYKKNLGINYLYLDLANQKVSKISFEVNEIIKLLDKIYDISVPKYMLIVGDWNVIPCQKFANKARKRRSLFDNIYVFSDLPYITLNTSSPWSGISYDFKNITEVGRIPTGIDNDFNEAISYFNTVINFKPITEFKDYGIAALPWKDTFKNVYEKLSTETITCPCNGIKKHKKIKLFLPIHPLTNYNFINLGLHGSDATHIYYGEDYVNTFLNVLHVYPEAFSKDVLPLSSNGYLIFSQACYGAKPFANEKNKDSILVNAIKNGCLGFIGSSVSAYTGTNGVLLFTNILQKKYIEMIKNGSTIGEAFYKGLQAVLDEEDNKYTQFKDITLLTISEFALYGDPSIVFYNNPNGSKSFKLKAQKYIEKIVDDEFDMIPMDYVDNMKSFPSKDFDATKKLLSKIKENGEKYMKTINKNFDDEEVYKIKGKEEYRIIYQKKDEDVVSESRIEFDNDGNVIAYIESC